MKICIKPRQYEDIWGHYIQKIKETGCTVVCKVEIDSCMGDVDAIITTTLTEDDLQKLPNLKAVFLFKTGTDGLPTKAIQDKGIKVFPSYANADVISEHAIALAFSLLHRIVEFDHDMRNDIWFSGGSDYNWSSMNSLKVGILGFGHIGKEIYKKMNTFSASIKVLNKSHQYSPGIAYAQSLDELLNWCDLLYICIPKSSDTTRLLGQHELHLLRNKYIINVSRAEVCDEGALYTLLANGSIKGYASDVWYCSPDKSDRSKKAAPAHYEFKSLSNVIMSPHCATHEQNAHKRYISDAVEQCIDYIKDSDEDVSN